MKLQMRMSVGAMVLAGVMSVIGAERPAIIPKPVEMKVLEGVFALTAKTCIIYADAASESTAKYLAEVLAPATGFKLEVTESKSAPERGIFLTTQGVDVSLGAEGYELAVAPGGVVIKAFTAAGLFYGCQTLRQLFSPAIVGASVSTGAVWEAPAVQVRDQPRYAWRGLMLDSARHFQSVDFVKKFMDVMALHKMNTLHLHLTDHQGWRIEIKGYPRLTEVGSIRDSSPMRGNRKKRDGKPYGPFFYTQGQVRELVAYAAARHITVVPEIEMPGHSVAALAAYPELSCAGGPFKTRTSWGRPADVYCAGNDKVFQFNRDVLTEVMGLFPSAFIHIGGDESPKTRWNACAKCKARMADKGLKDANELQSWFVRQMDTFLADHGRRLIGWDEILEGGLAPGTVVMSWRGIKGGIVAAKSGHDVVMSPTSNCYLDYSQSRLKGEPESIRGYIPLSTVYSYEPTPAELTPAQQKHVIGVQGNLWSEYLFEVKDVEFFAFPRACALSEVAWTPAVQKDFNDFWSRMGTHAERLKALNVNFRPLTPDQK